MQLAANTIFRHLWSQLNMDAFQEFESNPVKNNRSLLNKRYAEHRRARRSCRAVLKRSTVAGKPRFPPKIMDQVHTNVHHRSCFWTKLKAAESLNTLTQLITALLHGGVSWRSDIVNCHVRSKAPITQLKNFEAWMESFRFDSYRVGAGKTSQRFVFLADSFLVFKLHLLKLTKHSGNILWYPIQVDIDPTNLVNVTLDASILVMVVKWKLKAILTKTQYSMVVQTWRTTKTGVTST